MIETNVMLTKERFRMLMKMTLMGDDAPLEGGKLSSHSFFIGFSMVISFLIEAFLL